ncbi:MAG TPA: proline-specific permease ProY, partial [Streptomyces sp.]
GEAPAAFKKLSSTKTPAFGITVSVLFMGIGVVLNYIVPEKAFGYVTSIATAAGIWTWLMILISHVLYRRAVVAGRLPASSFPAPGGSVCSWIAIVFLLFVTGLIASDADARICLYVMAGWVAALGIGWAVLKKANPAVTERDGREAYDKIG